MKRGRRSTPAGEHRPVLLDDVLDVLRPRPSAIVVDCTVGWAGHSAELLSRVRPDGFLIGLDLDSENLARAEERLREVGGRFVLEHSNFAGLAGVLAKHGVERVDHVLADLGMSSMQVDDPERGFSYVRDGPLDMRMDRTRGRTAADALREISEADLCQALREIGDEPHTGKIASAIVTGREKEPIVRTSELARIISQAVGQNEGEWKLHPERGTWNLNPAALTFQTLRILVNRELANLTNLLRVLPEILKPGGRAAIISFHSGEDRLVKSAFKEGLHNGVYCAIAPEPIRASWDERQSNPRSRSAKLRWAERSSMSGR